MSSIKYHLIICGCPRSGTSAIVNLLNSHPSMIIGMERYKFYIKKALINKLKHSCFTKEFFFNFSEDQTNIIPGEKHPDLVPYYDNLALKYKETKGELIVGDKNPLAFRFYEEIENNLRNTKFIFMLRNIQEVAASYIARKENSDDTWSLGYEQAVKHWNESLSETWKYVQKRNNNIFVCEYEKIYSYNPEYLKVLTNFLDIELTTSLESTYFNMTQGWQKRRLNQNTISSQSQQYIHNYSDFETMNKLKCLTNNNI
jgi:hypothetical protein